MDGLLGNIVRELAGVFALAIFLFSYQEIKQLSSEEILCQGS